MMQEKPGKERLERSKDQISARCVIRGSHRHVMDSSRLREVQDGHGHRAVALMGSGPRPGGSVWALSQHSLHSLSPHICGLSSKASDVLEVKGGCAAQRWWSRREKGDVSALSRAGKLCSWVERTRQGAWKGSKDDT